MGTEKSIIELSPETRVIAARLGKLEPDEIITWKDIGGLIGSTDRFHIASRVRRAAKIVERERHFVIATVRGVGVKRLLTKEVPNVGEAARMSIRRKARRATTAMTMAEASGEMDDVTRSRVNSQRAMLGALLMFSDNRRMEAVEKRVSEIGGGELPPAKLLDLFRKPDGEKRQKQA